jgi:hypothetical protein
MPFSQRLNGIFIWAARKEESRAASDTVGYFFKTA